MLTVAEIMTREPYTLGPDDSLATARQLLTAAC
jgi:CBS domain-containing protein